METYTKESLGKSYKKDVEEFLQNNLEETSNSGSKLLDEIRQLNDKFDQLQFDVCITKNVNNLFLSSLLTLNINVGQIPSIQGGKT